MTEHEKLIEAYEDALFAVLMEDVAQNEGRKLLELNDQLKDDPKAAVPETLRKKSMKTIQNEFKKRSLRNMGRTSKKTFRKIVVAATISVLLFTTAFAVSEQIRVYTYNAVLAIFEDSTLFTFGATDMPPKQGNADSVDESLIYYYNIAPQNLPDGYELTFGYTSPFDSVCFSNNEGHEISINIIPFSSTVVYQFDTEGTEQHPVTIKGTAATMYSKYIDDTLDFEPYTWRNVKWIDHQRQIAVFASSTDLSEDELLQVIEGIVWNDTSV